MEPALITAVSTFETTYLQAAAQAEAGNYEAALDLLRPLLRDDQDAIKAWMLEGRVRAALGEFQAAERAFHRACVIAPESAAALLEQAHFAHVMGRAHDALHALEQTAALSLLPEQERDLSLLLAEVCFHLLQSEIMSALEQEADDSDDTAPQILAMTPSLQVLFAQGMNAITQVLQLAPRSPEAWDLQASYQTLQGDLKAAAKSWQQALRISPQDRHFLHELGTTLEALKDFQGAHQIYQQLAAIEHGRLDHTPAFAKESFAQAVQDIWHECERELLPSLDVDLPIELWVEDIPSLKLLEQAGRSHPFDPWMPLYLDVQTSNTAAATVYIILYQRNIESSTDCSDLDELQLHLYDLLEDTLYVLDAILNEDEIKA